MAEPRPFTNHYHHTAQHFIYFSSLSGMNTPNSAKLRRPSMAYVDVPPSPYSIVRDKAKGPSVPHTNSSTSQIRSIPSSSSAAPPKATPGRPKTQVYVDILPSPYHRNPALRPMSSLIPTSHTVNVLKDTGHENQKKRSIEHVDIELDGSAKKPKISATGDTLSCHQCRKPRDPSECIQCTLIIPSKSKTKDSTFVRCKEIYCQKCLQFRYSENVDNIKSSTADTIDRKGHVKKESYVFTCPACKDNCNCPRCRKSKGLEAIGRVRKTADSQVPLPDPVVKPGPRLKKSKPVPPVTWTPISTTMSYEDILVRLHIHEFITRFSPTFSSPVSKACLKELERVNEGDEDAEEGDLTPWVSEACVKSILLGLLDIIAADEGMEEDRPIIKETMKEMRAAGANLGKLYRALFGLQSTLQKDLSDSDYDLRHLLATLPDPLPPPANSTIRATRSVATDNGPALAVIMSAQLVPLISGLIEAAMRTDSVRASLEEGTAEVKEMTRAYRDAAKKENERWDAEKDSLKDTPEELKAARMRHKESLEALDSALKVVSHALAPRFAPLGSDDDGRQYWAISSGPWERDLAYELIEAKAGDATKNVRSKRPKRLLLTDEDRESLTDWSWFVAAWGVMPNEGRLHPDHSGVDASEKQWWAFWEPSEIERLCKWLEARGPDFEEKEGESQLGRPLVRALSDYSSGLKWRIQVSTSVERAIPSTEVE